MPNLGRGLGGLRESVTRPDRAKRGLASQAMEMLTNYVRLTRQPPNHHDHLCRLRETHGGRCLPSRRKRSWRDPRRSLPFPHRRCGSVHRRQIAGYDPEKWIQPRPPIPMTASSGAPMRRRHSAALALLFFSFLFSSPFPSPFLFVICFFSFSFPFALPSLFLSFLFLFLFFSFPLLSLSRPK